MVETLSNATGYVRRGQSVSRRARGQRRSRVRRRSESPTHENSSPPLSTLHSAQVRSRSARAAPSRNRGGVARGRGANMLVSLSRQDDGNAGVLSHLL